MKIHPCPTLATPEDMVALSECEADARQIAECIARARGEIVICSPDNFRYQVCKPGNVRPKGWQGSALVETDGTTIEMQKTASFVMGEEYGFTDFESFAMKGRGSRWRGVIESASDVWYLFEIYMKGVYPYAWHFDAYTGPSRTAMTLNFETPGGGKLEWVLDCADVFANGGISRGAATDEQDVYKDRKRRAQRFVRGFFFERVIDHAHYLEAVKEGPARLKLALDELEEVLCQD